MHPPWPPHCRYGSDITTTIPSSGRFTPEQAVVYNAVLDAQTAVKAAMRPGVAWPVRQRPALS